MHQFVAKILRDDRRSTHESFNKVVLETREQGGALSSSTATGGSKFYMGCLFTVRCHLLRESGSTGGHSLRNVRNPPLKHSASSPARDQERKAVPTHPTFGKFDLDHDEPAFIPSSLNGSFATAPTTATPAATSHRTGALFVDEEASSGSTPVGTPPHSHSDRGHSPRLRSGAPSDHLDGETATTEDFIVWASHEFLREYLPVVYSNVEGPVATLANAKRGASGEAVMSSPAASERSNSSNVFGHDLVRQRFTTGASMKTSMLPVGSLGSPVSSPSSGTPGLSLSFLSPSDERAVMCTRAADVLSADVETHHMTTRDRRIHAVTLAARDFSTDKPITKDGVIDAFTGGAGTVCAASLAPDTNSLCPVVQHRFIFLGGGMTRFLSAVKTLVPRLTCALINEAPVTDGVGSESANAVNTSGRAGLRYGQSTSAEDNARGSGGCPSKGPLEGSITFRADSPVAASGPASPPQSSGSAPAEPANSPSGSSGKGWRTRWPTSFFGLKKGTSGGSSAGYYEDSAHEMTGFGSSTTPHFRPSSGHAPPSTGRNEEANDPRSSESSFTDLSELEATRTLVPVLQLPRSSSGNGAGAHLRNTSGPSQQPPAFTPLSEDEWWACFEGPDNVLNYKLFEKARESVYRCGIASSSAHIRFEVWMYLLDVFTPNSTEADREFVLSANRTLYDTLTTQWTSMLPEQVANFRAFRERKQAIDKDVFRTDRALAMYKEDDSPYLKVLQRILMAHVQYNFDAGYSQGMSDVASVAVVLVHLAPKIINDWAAKIAGERGDRHGTLGETNSDSSADDEDDSEAGPSHGHAAGRPSRKKTSPVVGQLQESAGFLCFRAIISKHMSQNFSMEPARGMPLLLRQVQILTRHFAPDVYEHLKLCLSDDMTFCFRWLLVCFKREFSAMDDAMRLWDAIFGCPYTAHFEVVVIVALLVRTGTQITTNLHSCDMVLKFANNLAGKARVDEILQCAIDFYDSTFAVEVARLEGILQDAYVAPRQPTVEEAVKLCLAVDGDVAPR